MKRPFKWLYKSISVIPAIGDFVVFNGEFFQNRQNLFDETYINGGEDIDASLSVYLGECSYAIIDYKIDSVVGGTLGNKNRMLKDILNMVYMNKKIQAIGLSENVCNRKSREQK